MILPFALLLAAQAVETPSTGDANAAMIANCNAHMVEIPVTVVGRAGPKETHVKVCGKVGQTQADWEKTLKDALNKVSADARMSPSVKDQIIAGLKFEIAKLPAPAEARSQPQSQPAPLIAPTIAAPLVPKPPVDTGRAEYSALPPMPAPLPAVSVAASAAAAPPLPAPKLSFRCLSTDSVAGDGPCDLLERGMMVTVRADEDIAPGTSLRFVRRGDNRAEIDLGTLRRGQSQQFSLPARVCQGVTGSRVEIQVLRAAGSKTQVVDSRGPYELRC
ncbi:MAG TPA: hypothetical protein VF067_02085 [Sphingomicrobium sp.]